MDGEALFPVGLLELGADKYTDWNDRIRTSGANLVWDIGVVYNDEWPSRAAVRDSAEATGYKLLVGSPNTWNWDDPQTPEPEVGKPMYDPATLAEIVDFFSSSSVVIAPPR